MKIPLRLAGPAFIATAVIVTASCGRGTESVWTDESGLLRYVPADTSYVFAQGDAAPDELTDKLQRWAESVMPAYLDMFRATIGSTETGSALEDDERQRANALLDVLADLLTVEGAENAGLSREARLVVYGSGLLPVARITLSDGAKLEAAIARIEDAAGVKAATAMSGEHQYRYWTDDGVRVALAVIGNELVLTGSPVELADRHLSEVLDGGLPADNIAASGKLREIADRYGFGPYLTGFVDSARLAATFLDDQTGVDADLLALMDYDRSSLSEVCRSEIRDLALTAPRLVVGYTELNADRIAGRTVIELRQDLAAGLEGITAPVPGLGMLESGLVSFGMGVDIAAARDFYSARLAALEADPFECEALAQLANGMLADREIVNQPLPPAIEGLRGFVAALDELRGFDVTSGRPPTEISGRLLVASDDAPGLAAMGAAFSPEVAALKPDGQPARLNLPLPVPVDAYAALTPRLIALAVGPDAEARSRELLGAPTSELEPFLSWDVNYRRYYELLGQIATLAASADPSARADRLEATQQMLSQFSAGPFERATLDVLFTENGIEMPGTLILSD